MLVTEDLLQMSSIGKSHVPCQYCGDAEHQSSKCPQAEMCPTWKTINHSLKYI